MRHFTWIVGGVASLLMAAAISAHAEEPFATGSFTQACAAAKLSKRIVLIDFYTTWCGPCKLLEQKTWSDKEVRTWLVKNTVSRKIDAEKETALASKYKIDAYPTILLLKPDGTEIDRLVGYREPKVFLTEAHQALSGQDSIARAKTKLSGAASNDPMARMEYANALAEKAHNAEALKEYLWCLDNGKQSPGFYGVRLSFLLSDIMQLGTHYPPAIDALKQRRDTARAALEKGTTDINVVDDFTSYNEYLDQAEQTLAVYDTLRQKDPAVAKALFNDVFSLLLQKKRYADIVEGAVDVPACVDAKIAEYQQLASDSRIPGQEYRTYLKSKTLEMCGGFYEALAGTDKTTEADVVRNKLLAFDSSAAAYTVLVQHAARAGKPEAVQKLVQLAKAALSPKDFNLVEKAAAK